MALKFYGVLSTINSNDRNVHNTTSGQKKILSAVDSWAGEKMNSNTHILFQYKCTHAPKNNEQTMETTMTTDSSMEEENPIVAMVEEKKEEEEDETMTAATTLVDDETVVAKERPPPRLMITKMVSSFSCYDIPFCQHFLPPTHLIFSILF